MAKIKKLKEQGKDTKKAAAESKASIRDYGILYFPVITEKSSIIGADTNTTVFHVDPRASKQDVRRAVERVFSVQVEKVRTINYQGKAKRTTRSMGRRAAFKKAYVTLKEGQKIDIVEGL